MFDWDAHNTKLDTALADWDATERQIAVLHIETFTDIRRMIEEFTK